MATYLGAYGEVVMHVIVLCACAVMGLYAFRFVRLHRSPVGDREADAPEQTWKERPDSLAYSEGALERIFEAVNRERAALYALKEKKEVGAKRRAPVRRRGPVAGTAEGFRGRKKNLGAATDPDPYAEIVRLAAEGVDVKEISERVNLPKGEVLLALKLRARGASAGRTA